MSKTIIVSETGVFHDTLNKVLAETAKKIFVTFVSTKNADGTFWCPDCQRSDPVLNKVFNENGSTVIECVIPREGYKGNPEHPYRTDSQIQLKCIPTLIAWSKDGPADRLIDADCANEELVTKFIKSHQ
ncbi:thioredoxin fold domain-containing protein [Cavenderia fasciculata]|uniref:Thioredoxin fold domain-containing protein n=1 Tax=Cavenderia fasciculata TaxID=261658 RepID=F4PGC4_CACFS|nr:thioredoxin fold domain-containing protein [Cavenderia fasciculata]EGG24758.1 thioredoxin fold domain-containing protein [Cavenderia fasciculata]|eukprot:XP_004362609.1 thioredoxin fold domain-containing protein [Cavenderia fasciculata]